MLNKRGQIFPKFESLVFLGISESNKLWSDLVNSDFIHLLSIDPCFCINSNVIINDRGGSRSFLKSSQGVKVKVMTQQFQGA